VAAIPFSTIRKRQVTAVRLPEQEDTVRIYVKGAPELIVSKCVRTYDIAGKKAPMTDEQMNYIMSDIIQKKFTTQGYRVLAFAYKDMPFDEFNAMKERNNDFVSENDRIELERDLTFVGAFALQDDLRDNVNRSVLYAKRGMINVRMVSGDNLETAVAVAIKAGILTEEESKHSNACITGEEFRRICGEVRKEFDADRNEKVTIQNKDEFRTVVKNLRVLARAIPYDKYLLVTGLKELGKTVAATGEGINDVDAL